MAFRIAVCRITGVPLAILFWWAVAGIWGALFAWLYRDYMNPDGISYLDMASNALAHGPRGLANVYWSPLYPALIAIWELILQPSPAQEFASVHALNAVIYFAAAISFGFFLRELILFRAPERGPLWKQGAFIAFAFTIFFCYVNADITPWVLTPDLSLTTIEFAAAGLFFRIVRSPGKLRTHAALGGVLAMGYYAKAVLLPAAIVLLGILYVCRFRDRAHRKNVLIAAAVMLLACAPQIVTISNRVGHLSIGETARLNYLWWVQGIRMSQGWTGTPGGDTPIHGPRLLVHDPEVLEFAEPIGGTYPLWYDPAYWHEGAKVRFDLRDQLATLRVSLSFYKRHFADLLRYPFAGLILLIVLSVASRRKPRAAECWFVIWPLASLIMYALLLTEHRYIAPCLILFWTGAYSALLARNGTIERVLLILLAGLILLPRLTEFQKTYHKLSQPAGEPGNVVMARDLHEMGIAPGDPIATVGLPFAQDYARIARLKIVAQITDGSKFWSLPPETAIAVEQAIANGGAKLLIGSGRPAGFQPDLWHNMPGAPYTVLVLSKPVDQEPSAARK